MSLAFIAATAPISESAMNDAVVRPMVMSTAVDPGSFGSLVSSGISQVSEKLQASEVDLQKLATGHADNLHQIMIRLEESRLSFQLMLQVRNRLLESYQEVMRMQV